MRKILVCAALCFVAGFYAKAQNPIPNHDFENWTGVEPNGWTTQNASTNGNYSTVKVTPGYTGSYAMQVKTILNSNTHQNEFGYAAAGFKMTTRPLAFTGFYKCNVISGDSVTIDVTFFKSGAAIGTTHWGSKTTATAPYKYLSSLVNYTSVAIPDSSSISIIGGDPSTPKIGTSLTIDNISFDGLNTTAVAPAKSGFTSGSVFPNPASDRISAYINVQSQPVTVKVMDVLGNTVKVVLNNELRPPGSDLVTFSAENLANGFYFLTVSSNDKMLSTERFVINR